MTHQNIAVAEKTRARMARSAESITKGAANMRRLPRVLVPFDLTTLKVPDDEPEWVFDWEFGGL